MPKYIITHQADEDINEILAYIAPDNFDAEMKLFDRLVALFEMLADHRCAGRERPELKEDLHSFPEGNYLIFYRLWAGNVAIVRVIHGSRDLEEIFS